MKTNALYGGFFAFLPRVKTFLLETVFPEHAVCRACGKISEGGVLCRECENRLRSDGMVDAWDRRIWNRICRPIRSVHIPEWPVSWFSA